MFFLSFIVFIIFNFFYIHANEPKDLYLDLTKRILINSIYKDYGQKGGIKESDYNEQIRSNGLDWPMYAHTMVGKNRLDNVQFCVEDVIRNEISGDLIETGVWRGGVTILMRAILKVYNDTKRIVWVADSFQGLPAPNPSLYPADKGIMLHTYKELAISLEQVKENFACYGLLDSQVKFLKGWFKDTLPNAPIKQLAIMRLDGDLYESTMDALVNLYPKLSIGGYVIIDDYSMEFCRRAVEDFRRKNDVQEELVWVDHTAVFWKRLR